MDRITLTREIRAEIAKELYHRAKPICSKVTVTFTSDGIFAFFHTPSNGDYIVPGGVRTVTVKDGLVEET